MELRVDAPLPFSCATVFTAYRDDIAKLLPYLPNVRAIDVKSRVEAGSRVEIVNVWHGGGEVPAAIRVFLSEAMLAWTDYATWDAASMQCDWRTETHAFTDAVHCHGRNAFVEQGPDATMLQIRGTIEIDTKKIRRVAGFLAGRVGAALEEFIVSKIQSNLLETTRGMVTYLENRSRQP